MDDLLWRLGPFPEKGSRVRLSPRVTWSEVGVLDDGPP